MPLVVMRGSGVFTLPLVTLSIPSPSSMGMKMEWGAVRKLLLAASTGGHLAQLHRLADSLGASPDSLWVTFDSPQSRSLLAGRRTLFVPYVSPRDWRGATETFRRTRQVLQDETFDAAVSTGAGMAIGVFLAARLKDIPLTYIESVSRVTGPSLTGRIAALSHSVELRTQHAAWESRRWRYAGNVLEEYHAEPIVVPREPRSIFVTLGTIRPYRFDAAVDALLRTGMAGRHTSWQLGVTDRSDLPGETHELLDAAQFEQLARSADVVVTHAGVGTLLQLLEWGVHPVVLIRRAARGEHVDDHQEQIGQLLREAGLAVVVEAPELSPVHLRQAASMRNAVRQPTEVLE
jgi:UDP-N-acetylglucosamine transferase subunit ALG13